MIFPVQNENKYENHPKALTFPVERPRVIVDRRTLRQNFRPIKSDKSNMATAFAICCKRTKALLASAVCLCCSRIFFRSGLVVERERIWLWALTSMRWAAVFVMA